VHKQRPQTKEVAVENNYNKWSVELAGGFNKPTKRMTPGYRTAVVSPYVLTWS
jgi:OOP family OmpA-OmpF porin